MRLVRSASEDEVIAAFLRAEIVPPVSGQSILAALEADHQPRSIVDSANLRYPQENRYRRSLLGPGPRVGPRQGNVPGLPAEVVWNLAAVTPKELAEVRYIAWDWWSDRSAGTRLATEYARRIRAGDYPGDPDSGFRHHEPVARRLREGPPLPLLIVVRERSRPKFIVLVEGHIRLTAFFLFPEMLPEELELYLGTAIALDRWGLY